MFNNKFIPINIQNFKVFLDNYNVDIKQIDIDHWVSLIDDTYCKYYDGEKICCTKIRNINCLFCSKHNKRNNDIDENESITSEQTLVNTLENLTLDDKYKSQKSSLILNNNNLKILLESIKKLNNDLILYEDKHDNLDMLHNAIINFRNLIFNNNTETFIEASYISQYFESINDIYNDFLNDIGKEDKKLERWKNKMNELIQEFQSIPDEYILLNNRITL